MWEMTRAENIRIEDRKRNETAIKIALSKRMHVST